MVRPQHERRPRRTETGGSAITILIRRWWVVVALVLLASAWGVWALVRRPAVDLPAIADQNVLLVTVDTLRGDALGCDGGPARTPNLDAIAASGIRFSFAHAHTVITLPSHASILTGTLPFQHGYRENSGYRLKPGMPTIATLLKASGFATGAFVGAFPLDGRFGLTPGFDVYDGRFDDASGAGFLIAERPATTVVRQATTWIRAQSHRWFTWVHVYDPHAPYQPPPPYDREYADRPYYGEVAAVDHALGPLFDLVRGLTRPTLVIVTGDHGEALGDHGETTHGLFAYESTLHVPLLVARVGVGQPAAVGVSDAPARHVDIVPTILDTLQLPVPADLPGHSLRRRADRDAGVDRPTYFEAMSGMLDFGWAPLTGVLAGREKYIDLPLPELYDLGSDPRESTNISARAPDRQRVLAARLSAFGPALPGAATAEDPDVARRLQALGYVSGGAARKSQYTEDDDPKRLVDLDKALHDAVALDEAGRLHDAMAIYQQVLARRSDMMAASRHLAFDYWRTGDAESAIATLRSALAKGPTWGAQVQLGTYLTEVGRAAEALNLLERAAAADPNLDALNALGIAYARTGRTADALATFDRSLKIDPENAMTHTNLGAIHLDAGRIDQAEAEFARALKAEPDSAQGIAGMAMVAIRKGDRATAIANWKRAVALDPQNFDALYDLSVQLIRAGQIAEARPYVERFIRTAPASLYAKDIRDFEQMLKRLP
jgi:arylsulfatase A-like enzyme/Tfp pilus assembly protein PilF